MADLEKKIKEYYDAKGLTEIQLHKIQRMMRKPKRRMRILLYGPIAAIFFVAVMSKITLHIIKNDAEVASVTVAQSDVEEPAGPPASMDKKAEMEERTAVMASKPPLVAMRKAKKAEERRSVHDFSVSMAPAARMEMKADMAPPAAGGTRLVDMIPLAGFDAVDGEREKFDAELKAHLKGIDEVYRKYLKTSGNLAGTLVYRVALAADGTVRDVAAEENKTGNAPFGKTVTAMVKSWKFSATGQEKTFRLIVACKPPQ